MRASFSNLLRRLLGVVPLRIRVCVQATSELLWWVKAITKGASRSRVASFIHGLPTNSRARNWRKQDASNMVSWRAISACFMVSTDSKVIGGPERCAAASGEEPIEATGGKGMGRDVATLRAPSRTYENKASAVAGIVAIVVVVVVTAVAVVVVVGVVAPAAVVVAAVVAAVTGIIDIVVIVVEVEEVSDSNGTAGAVVATTAAVVVMLSGVAVAVTTAVVAAVVTAVVVTIAVVFVAVVAIGR